MENQMKDGKEKKEFARESELSQVPIYRAYGVKKKEGFFAHVNELLATLIAAGLYILCFVYITIGLVVFTLLLGAFGVVIWAIILLLFIYFVVLRKVRKRAKFFKKLKKVAKENGLKVEKQRGFWQGLRLNKEGFDFTVTSDKKIWFVRFFTMPKKRQKLIIESDKKIKLIKVKGSKKFFLARNTGGGRIGSFSGDSPKYTLEMEYSFDEKPTSIWQKKCAKALVLNPSPFELYYRDRDGAVIPTGTGHPIYDYTIFTGSGFLNTLGRESSEI